MRYTGYLIIVNGQNIKKKSVLEISIFELPKGKTPSHAGIP